MAGKSAQKSAAEFGQGDQTRAGVEALEPPAGIGEKPQKPDPQYSQDRQSWACPGRGGPCFLGGSGRIDKKNRGKKMTIL